MKHEEADRVGNKVVFGTREPFDLEQFLLAVVKHFDLALNEELDVVLLCVVLSSMKHFIVFSILGGLSIFIVSRFDTRKLYIDLCVVRVKEVPQHLNVVLVGDVEGLFHRRAL